MTETLAIVLGVALLAAVAVLLKHRFWPMGPDDEPREDVAEYIAMMVGVLYALLLGLALVTVWDANASAEEHVQAEAGAAHQIHLLADGLPPAPRVRLKTRVEAYVRHVTETEWPRMAEGGPLSPEGWRLLGDVRSAAQAPEGAPRAVQVVAEESLAQLGMLDDARRGREADLGERLSPILWLGLVAGGILTVLFMFLFGVQRNFTHVVMAMGLSGLITFMVLLIHQWDEPFSGWLAVDATPFTRYF
ncbi:bestrophin-like domain [Streptomyces sp. NPDC054863]